MPACCSIFFHNYYGNDQEWLNFFSEEFTLPCNLFYNTVSSSYYNMIRDRNPVVLQQQASGTHLKQFILKTTTNVGKDIGGKLVLMDAYLKLGIKSDFILLLHDKASPYHGNNQQWKKSLFRIAEKQHREKVIALFRNDPGTGIVASANMIRNEQDNEQMRDAYTDSDFIKELRNKYGIRPPHLSYVTGTMFWVRAALFEAFFKEHSPLKIRSTLEQGNVTDETPTVTHAWERLLCWLVTARGYQIKGV